LFVEERTMTVSRRELLVAGAALPVAGLWASVTRGQDRPIGPTAVAPAGLSEDPVLAAELLIARRKQIGNSQFAVQRTQHPDVRAFAEAEVAEHQLIQRRLSDRGFQYPTVTPLPAAIAGGAPVDAVPGVPGNPPPEPTANRPLVLPPGTQPAKNATPPPPPPAGAPPRAAGPHAATPLVSVGRLQLPADVSRVILIETQVGDQCVATFQAETGSLSGPAFDRAYVGCQLHEHYALFDRATVFRRHASPAMLAVLDEGLPVIQRHLVALKGLIGKV
jgi:predicted outer membrane protein